MMVLADDSGETHLKSVFDGRYIHMLNMLSLYFSTLTYC